MWTEVLVAVWIAAIIGVLVQVVLIQRKLKKTLDRFDRPSGDPEVVAAGRRLYDDGEFKRQIVKRTPRDLFSDRVELSCGHEAETTRNDRDENMNCHRCAQEWINRQGSLDRLHKP